MNRILFADGDRRLDETMFRSFPTLDEFAIIGRAATPEQVLTLIKMADAVLLNVNVAGDQTVGLIAEIVKTRPSPQSKIMVVGASQEPDTIISYVEAGADGFILAGDSCSDAIRKTRAVLHERTFVPPQIAAAIMNRVAELAQRNSGYLPESRRKKRLGALSPREREVLGLVARGHGNREIADELFIEYGTVKNHVHSILKKLDVENRHEAASLYHLHRKGRKATDGGPTMMR